MTNLDHVHFQHKTVIYFVLNIWQYLQLRLFVNTRCVYSTELRGSFCSRMLRQISHLLEVTDKEISEIEIHSVPKKHKRLV